jgi:hypothetical protein
MSDFINYFAPLAQDERTPITQEPIKNGLWNRRSVARVARRRAIEHQRTEDAQVEQNESLTRNKNSGEYSNGFDTKIISVSIQSIKKEIKITISLNIHLYIILQILKC